MKKFVDIHMCLSHVNFDFCLGSSVLYKQFVHPALMKREQEIDSLLDEAKNRGYTTILQLAARGARY